MAQLVRFDTAALNKALVGYDQLFLDFEGRFASQVQNNYPPHNILKYDDERYEIQVAVAGFRKDEIEVTTENNILIVKGVRFEEPINAEYIHKGLAARDFERYFKLEGYLEVYNAEIKDGLLIIKLIRNVPEEKKPKTIKIK